ncbi:MAG: hypothetical protein IKO53_08715 [Lachnospiraceae bacterium]|nr:hypothetical protein [Lachnospiraceae bacterium]
MFYLFTDTPKLFSEWLRLKKRKYRLWEYYIFKKWRKTYDGLKPDKDTKKALIYLGELTRSIHMKETEDLTEEQVLVELENCWNETLRKLSTDIKIGQHFGAEGSLLIALDFLETDFADGLYGKGKDNPLEDGCRYRLIGQICRVRNMYDLDKAYRSEDDRYLPYVVVDYTESEETDEYEEYEDIGSELNRIWDIEESEAQDLLHRRMDWYSASRYPFPDRNLAEAYLRYNLHYVYELADNKTHSRYADFLLLSACHYPEYGERSILGLIAEEASVEYPDDDILLYGPYMIRAVTDEDMDAIVDFLEWDVLKDFEGWGEDWPGDTWLYLGYIWGTYIGTEDRSCRMKRRAMRKGQQA